MLILFGEEIVSNIPIRRNDWKRKQIDSDITSNCQDYANNIFEAKIIVFVCLPDFVFFGKSIGLLAENIYVIGIRQYLTSLLFLFQLSITRKYKKIFSSCETIFPIFAFCKSFFTEEKVQSIKYLQAKNLAYILHNY